MTRAAISNVERATGGVLQTQRQSINQSLTASNGNCFRTTRTLARNEQGLVIRTAALLRIGTRSKMSKQTAARAVPEITAPLLRDPVWVYDIWSAYTDGFYNEYFQLPDDTRLTEELAMLQLRELGRLQRSGVHFDYYMMNAFWFDADGGYRKWRRSDWPNGPDAWIDGCYSLGLKPGLWFGTNSLWKINPAPQWRDSLAHRQESTSTDSLSLDAMSMYEGGFLADFINALQYWYDRGIRMFEFDVANFDAATPRALTIESPEDIRKKNKRALSKALKEFRRANPDVMLAAFNGFGGDMHSTASPFPFQNPLDLRSLEVFDSMYTGDTRVSDVPLINFWRSVDLFNDHMTRRFEQCGVPLERTDPFFTLSPTWFGYQRKKKAWRGMLLLSVARGSWKKTIYGDLQLLNDEDARWFAKVQGVYAPLMAMGRTKSFGGIPGKISPYGFGSYGSEGAIYTVVNPTQKIRRIQLPPLSKLQSFNDSGRVLFRDDGYVPILDGTTVTLGPEQMSVIGFGRYADEGCDLGIEPDILIPNQIRQIDAKFEVVAQNSIEAVILPPPRGGIRVVVSQLRGDRSAPRSAPLRIEAEQNGNKLEVAQPDQERAVATGISWATGEIGSKSFERSRPVTLRCTSPENSPVTLTGNVYAVVYDASGSEPAR